MMKKLAYLLIVAASSAGCFSPDIGNGTLQCAVGSMQCPADHYCASDGKCWKNGTGPTVGGDLAMPDLAPKPPDLTQPMPDLTQPMPDLTQPMPDLTQPMPDLSRSDGPVVTSKAARGNAFVTGGVSARSTNYKAVMSLGVSPAGNPGTSTNYKAPTGLVGATQKGK